MSGDSSHPARKISHQELKEFLADKREEVPAVTTRIVATEFSDVQPETVSNNLETLAKRGEICRLNDGNNILWWYPREQDEAGDIPYEDIVDDSIDYEEIQPEEVPRDIAEEIAHERLPYYRPRSFWTQIAGFSQLGIILSLGIVVLGFGEIAANPLGLTQASASLLLQLGMFSTLILCGVYTFANALDLLSAKGFVTEDPLPFIWKKMR